MEEASEVERARHFRRVEHPDRAQDLALGCVDLLSQRGGGGRERVSQAVNQLKVTRTRRVRFLMRAATARDPGGRGRVCWAWHVRTRCVAGGSGGSDMVGQGRARDAPGDAAGG